MDYIRTVGVYVDGGMCAAGLFTIEEQQVEFSSTMKVKQKKKKRNSLVFFLFSSSSFCRACLVMMIDRVLYERGFEEGGVFHVVFLLFFFFLFFLPGVFLDERGEKIQPFRGSEIANMTSIIENNDAISMQVYIHPKFFN